MKTEKFGNITLIQGDCEEYLKTIPNGTYDIGIIDPPYGIGVNKMTLGNGRNKIYRGNDDWDNKAPSEEYFAELRRVTKNQVVWGANHFIERMPINSSCWIVWDKGTGDNDFADAELAWTSFKSPVRKYFKSWVGANAKEKTDINRIHPTQKPVELYAYVLKKFAKPGDKILDTHGGSMSIAIACHDLGFELTVIEKDPEYYAAARQRLINHQMQGKLF